jgi:hypothetical protein
VSGYALNTGSAYALSSVSGCGTFNEIKISISKEKSKPFY